MTVSIIDIEEFRNNLNFNKRFWLGFILLLVIYIFFLYISN